jgi:hypothetical protein
MTPTCRVRSLFGSMKCGTGMRAAIATIAFLIWPIVFAQSVDPDAAVRVEIGIDGDPGHLIKALYSAGYSAEMGIEASDQARDDAQSVWIGRNVPFQSVKDIVRLALERYPHLRYYRFFGNDEDAMPPEWNRMIYVGGSKWAAHENTKAVASADAKALFAGVTSQQELHRLIESFRQ